MFWICAGNSVDNIGMFYLLLSSSYTESRPFLLLTPPHQRVGWGCTRTWEETRPGQLTQTDLRDIPHHMMPCSATKLGGGWAGGLLRRDWLGIGQLVVSNCFHLQHFSFLGFICLSLLFSSSLHFFYY